MQLELAVPHLLEVLRHDLRRSRSPAPSALDLAADPGALGPIEDRLHARLVRRPAAGSRDRARSGRGGRARRRRARRRASAWRRPGARPSACSSRPGSRARGRTAPRPGPGVALVHQHRAALEQIAVAFQGEVDGRSRAADGPGRRRRPAAGLRRDQRLLEGDALVARQHRLADADQAVAVAHRGRDVGDLVAARLALLGRCRPAAGRLRGRTTRCSAAAGGGPRRAPCPRGCGATRLASMASWASAALPAGPGAGRGRARWSRTVSGGREPRLVAVADGLDQQSRSDRPSNWSLPSTSKTWPPSALRASSSFSSSLR